jgi:hypothetical protein
VPELIRLELETTAYAEREYAASYWNGRERRLYMALLAIASFNVFLISGALAFLWLVFRN